MKNAYKKFAYYYDEVIQETNYDLWVEFVEPYLKKDDKILDLACGTGTFITMLKLNGYEFVSGLDLSDEIIEIANEKRKIKEVEKKQISKEKIEKYKEEKLAKSSEEKINNPKEKIEKEKEKIKEDKYHKKIKDNKFKDIKNE